MCLAVRYATHRIWAVYQVLSKEELTRALQQANHSVILLDDSIRERPKVEQFYVVSAVQPRFESKDGAIKPWKHCVLGWFPLLRECSAGPIGIPVEAWQIDGGKTAEKMCELIPTSCDVRMSIASIGLGKNNFLLRSISKHEARLLRMR